MYLDGSGVFARACPGQVSGCYLTNGQIHTTWTAVIHELVHAVSEMRGPTPDLFWAEGIATAYEVRRLSHGPYPGIEQVMVEKPGVGDYPAAGHFVRWVRETWGMDPLIAVVDGQSTLDALGMDGADLVAAYEADAAWSYDGASTCWGDPIEDIGGDFVGVSAKGESGTYFNHPFPFSQRYAVVNVSSEGTYEVAAKAEDPSKIATLNLTKCVRGTVQVEPDTLVAGEVDTTLVDDPFPIFNSETFETVRVRLEPGDYQLQIPTASTRVEFEIRRVSE